MTEISTTQPLRCSSMTKRGEKCRGYAVVDETTCVSHTPELAKRAQDLATRASVEARQRRVVERKEAQEAAKLSLTEVIRNHAAIRRTELAESLVAAAVADGSSRAMAELLNRVEGKVVDRLETTEGDPFAKLDIEELRRLAMGIEAPLEPAEAL